MLTFHRKSLTDAIDQSNMKNRLGNEGINFKLSSLSTSKDPNEKTWKACLDDSRNAQLWLLEKSEARLTSTKKLSLDLYSRNNIEKINLCGQLFLLCELPVSKF